MTDRKPIAELLAAVEAFAPTCVAGSGTDAIRAHAGSVALHDAVAELLRREGERDGAGNGRRR